MGVLWKVVAVLGLALGAAQAQAEFVSIAGKSVNVRQGPSTQHDVSWELSKGDPMKVT